MANEALENPDIRRVKRPVRTAWGIGGAKMTWIILLLKKTEVPFSTGQSLDGKQALYMDIDHVREVHSILNQAAGTLFESHNPVGDEGFSLLTYADLPDDSPVFHQMIMFETGMAHPTEEIKSEVHILQYSDRHFPGQDYLVRMVETQSSQVSAIGYDLDPRPMKDFDEGHQRIRIYVTFKGTSTYRYSTLLDEVTMDDWFKLYNEALEVAKGNQEASVGSLNHTLLRKPADDGLILCEKLWPDDSWVVVPKKSDRPKPVRGKKPNADESF